MRLNPKILTAGVVVLAAVAAVNLMQRGSSDGAGLAAVTPAQAGVVPVPTVLATRAPSTPNQVQIAAAGAAQDPADATPAAKFPGMPRPPQDAIMPAPLPQNGPSLQSRMALTTPAPAPAAPVRSEPARNEFGLSCGVILTATPKDAAMVGVTLTAPCRGDERFTLRHGDLSFAARMTRLGTFVADVPALGRDAVFSVTFADGERTTTEATVPLAEDVDRVVLQSRDQTGLQIHALEFGADYGQAGHIWSGNPRNPVDAAREGGGFITVLGDSSLTDAQTAEIYTFPANTRNRDGVVRLSIEAEVTAGNCGREITGQTLQNGTAGSAEPVALTLSVPDCDAIGEFLVLKNLLRDLKIASN